MDAHDRTFFLVSSPDVLPMSSDKFRCSPGKRVCRLLWDEGGGLPELFMKNSRADSPIPVFRSGEGWKRNEI